MLIGSVWAAGRQVPSHRSLGAKQVPDAAVPGHADDLVAPAGRLAVGAVGEQRVARPVGPGEVDPVAGVVEQQLGADEGVARMSRRHVATDERPCDLAEAGARPRAECIHRAPLRDRPAVRR